MTEPETEVVLETAAGLVRTVATCRDGRCERVTLDAPPSFVEELDVPLEVPGYGTVRVDVAYGGCYYLLVDAAQLGVRLERGAARAIVEAAQAIQDAARDVIRVQHPTVPEIDFISYVMVTGDDEPEAGRLRGATVLSGRIDRSPCGTGNAARMACMVARGQAAVGSRFTSRSLIDSEFEVEIVGTTEIGDRTAVLPRVSGRGFVVGTRTASVDPADPYPLGYALSDLWDMGVLNGGAG
jgi:proline racemase